MSDFLFTYGTLRPGHASGKIASVAARLQPECEGYIHGVLYDLGRYPGALIDANSERKIFGQVSKLPDDPECLRALDAYEDYDPKSPPTSLYLREVHPVHLADGSTRLCWVYVYNQPIGSARIVESGRYDVGTKSPQ
jgi:gamma-glutamylcyclotransferase (GGCT)/AIG2-like uncharacterized protein YtfP